MEETLAKLEEFSKKETKNYERLSDEFIEDFYGDLETLMGLASELLEKIQIDCREKYTNDMISEEQYTKLKGRISYIIYDVILSSRKDMETAIGYRQDFLRDSHRKEGSFTSSFVFKANEHQIKNIYFNFGVMARMNINVLIDDIRSKKFQDNLFSIVDDRSSTHM